MQATKAVLQAVAVTAELTGTEMSPAAAKVMAEDLARYPEAWVLGALTRCRRELRGRLTLAEIINRIDDGRPGPDEAWAMLPRTEDQTAVWTEEMRNAYGAAAPLIAEDDMQAARFAFRESYAVLVQRARSEAKPAVWTVTLGHDPHARESVIVDAVQKGRLTADYAMRLLPYRDDPSPALKQLIATKPVLKLVGRE